MFSLVTKLEILPMKAAWPRYFGKLQKSWDHSMCWFLRHTKELMCKVNCAGQAEHYQPLADIPVATWWGSIQTNILGTFLVSRHFINQSSPPARRVIINISSNAAIEPIVVQYQCPSGYTIGKTGSIRLGRTPLTPSSV